MADPVLLTTILGVVLTALGCYRKGFRDGSYLSGSLKLEIQRLAARIDHLETKESHHLAQLDLLNEKIARLREANATLTREVIALQVGAEKEDHR